MRKKSINSPAGGRRMKRVVSLCLADVINLELACEYMTEAADVISHRGQKSLEWQRAFCKRLKAQLTQANESSSATA